MSTDPADEKLKSDPAVGPQASSDNAALAKQNQSSPPAESPDGAGKVTNSKPRRAIKKIDPTIMKTVLDTEACTQIVSKLSARKETRLKEIIESPIVGVEPPKPLQPIEKYRPASPCGAKWEGPPDGLRFEICKKCKLHVYDFTKMDMAEVNKLVYSREAKENSQFFRRQDGKFITRDCPIGLGRKVLAISLGIVAVVAIGGIAALYAMMPPPPKPVMVVVPKPEVVVRQRTVSISGKPTRALVYTNFSGPKKKYTSHIFKMVGNQVVEVNAPAGAAATQDKKH